MTQSRQPALAASSFDLPVEPPFQDRAELSAVQKHYDGYAGAQTKWQRPGPEATHVIVAPGWMQDQNPSQFARPVPTSNARMIQRAALGNIRFELPVDADCGYTDPMHMVVCLDADYRITPIEQLRVLSFAADPIRAHAGSERAVAVISDLLAKYAPATEVDLLRDERCTGDCDRRITLELK